MPQRLKPIVRSRRWWSALAVLSLIPFLGLPNLPVARPALGVAGAPQEIHLSWAGGALDHVTVAWVTSTTSDGSRVRYGRTPSLEDGYRDALISVVPNVPNLYLHVASMGPLERGAKYYYSAGDNVTGWSPLHKFRSAPSGATPFTFVAVGDTGVDPGAAANIARMVEADPAFVLDAGDLAYAGGDQAVWDSWFQQVQPLASQAPYMPTLGNHEYESGYNLSAYLGRFALPGNERWYSFNYSSVHIVSVDSGPSDDLGPPPGATAWLEADLKYSSEDPLHPWTIVVFHYPPFTSGTMGSWTSGRSLWSPLLDRYGVELVINGHQHSYERTWPVSASGVVAQHNYIEPKAPVYVVTGGGGESLIPFKPLQPPWSAFRAVTDESLRITVDGANMTVLTIAPNGTQVDGFTITHAPVPPVVTIGSPPGNSSASSNRISVSGRATDPTGGGITRVEVRVNGGPWMKARGIDTWRALVDLARGANVIQARAWNQGGVSSAIVSATVSFRGNPPKASFTLSPVQGDVQTTFTANASSSSDPQDPPDALEVRWDWNGDGVWDTSWSTQKVAQHRFSDPGTYTLRLQVRDFGGLTGEAARALVVSPQLVVLAGANPTSGVAPFRVSFSSSVAGGLRPYVYSWDFGDGATSSDPRPTHTYRASGTFTVTLTARGAGGRAVTSSIRVTASPSLGPANPALERWAAYVATSGALVLPSVLILRRRRRNRRR